MVVNIKSLLFQVVCAKVKMVQVIGQACLFFPSLWCGTVKCLLAFRHLSKPFLAYIVVSKPSHAGFGQLNPDCMTYPEDKPR